MEYQIKNTREGDFQDISTMFDGVRVLKMDGFLQRGEPVNIYNAQWVNSQEEDFLITTKDTSDNPVVIRKNTDIELTFIVREKYASNQKGFNVLSAYHAFVDYITGSDVWISSQYAGNANVHCVCLKEVKPTSVKLHRGKDSYALATVTLHTLDCAYMLATDIDISDVKADGVGGISVELLGTFPDYETIYD